MEEHSTTQLDAESIILRRKKEGGEKSNCEKPNLNYVAFVRPPKKVKQ